MTARAAGPLLPFQPGKPVGNIYYGACSWTDRTLIDAGTFYPPSVRTAADRLAHYASEFRSWRWTRPTTPCRRSATHISGWIARRPASRSTSKPSACSLALLEKLGIAYVVVDEPQGFRSSTPPVVAATSPLAVVRFHGQRRDLREAQHRRGRAVSLPVHGGGAERLGLPDPRPCRAGGTGCTC